MNKKIKCYTTDETKLINKYNLNQIINELKGGNDNVSLSIDNSNYIDTLTSVKSIKSIVRKEVTNNKPNRVKFRVYGIQFPYGRGNNIQSLIDSKQIGRFSIRGVWWNNYANKNECSLNSAAAYYMNSFTLYFYLRK